jgi:hypothetical protein
MTGIWDSINDSVLLTQRWLILHKPSIQFMGNKVANSQLASTEKILLLASEWRDRAEAFAGQGERREKFFLRSPSF